MALVLCPVFAASGVATAFLPLWLQSRGLDAASIGAALGFASLVRVAAVPGWGVLADGMQGRGTVILVAAVLATAVSAALFPAHGPVALTALVVLQAVASAPLQPLGDTLTLALAGEGRLHYGPVRAAGSAAFMAATFAAGPLIATFGTRAVPAALIGCYAVLSASARLLPEAASPPRRPSAAGGARLLRNPAFLLTLGASALVQGSHAAYYALATVHWRAHGLSDTAIGGLWAEAVAAEIAFFVWGRGLAERIGPPGLTALAAGAALLRWTVTSQTVSLPVLAAAQLLHAGSFGMQHLSSMLTLSRAVPPERAATAQALHSALGTGAPTGLLIWGVGALYDGSGRVFLLMALAGGAGLAFVPGLRRSLRTA